MNAAPWLPKRFYDEAINEAQRKFMGTLWNTYAFYVLYANIDGYNPYDETLPAPEYTVMDRWVQSRLHSLIATVTEHMDAYHRGYRGGPGHRLLCGGTLQLVCAPVPGPVLGQRHDPDKSAAYRTLYTVLSTMAKLTAPLCAFYG